MSGGESELRMALIGEPRFVFPRTQSGSVRHGRENQKMHWLARRPQDLRIQ